MKPSGEVIFGRKATRETWSPRQERNEGGTRQGDAPTPLGAPSTLVVASGLFRSIYDAPWASSGPKTILVIFRSIDSVWYSFSVNLKNKEKTKTGTGL